MGRASPGPSDPTPEGQRSGLNLHRTRRGFALEMRRAVSLEAASQALEHSDLSTTMRHYGQWADEELAAAFEMLAAIASGGNRSLACGPEPA